MRNLTGFWNIVIIIFSISLVVFHLYTAALGAFPELVQRGIHLGFVLTMTFYIAPPRKQKREENKVPFYDIFLSILFRVIVILAGIMLVVPNTISSSIRLVVLIICFTQNIVFRQSIKKLIGNC